jgi:hypothetical protein
MTKPRAPISPHGRLFGGDSMYEVLAEVARRRRGSFNAHQIAQVVDRHPSQVQRDLDRLITIGVLEPVDTAGAAKPLRRRHTQLARTVVALPRLIENEIGSYPRPDAPPTLSPDASADTDDPKVEHGP